jgi:hypothetical protein
VVGELSINRETGGRILLKWILERDSEITVGVRLLYFLKAWMFYSYFNWWPDF